MSIEEQLRAIEDALNKLGSPAIQNSKKIGNYSIHEELNMFQMSEPIPSLPNKSFNSEESNISQTQGLKFQNLQNSKNISDSYEDFNILQIIETPRNNSFNFEESSILPNHEISNKIDSPAFKDSIKINNYSAHEDFNILHIPEKPDFSNERFNFEESKFQEALNKIESPAIQDSVKIDNSSIYISLSISPINEPPFSNDFNLEKLIIFQIQEVLNKYRSPDLQDQINIDNYSKNLALNIRHRFGPPESIHSESFNLEESNILQRNDAYELRILLDQEQKRTENLENVVKRKDKLLNELWDLEKELYENLEEMQSTYYLDKEKEYQTLIEELVAKEQEFANEWLTLNRKILDLNIKIEQGYLNEKNYLAQIHVLNLKSEMKQRSENFDLDNAKIQISSLNEEILILNKEIEDYKYLEDKFLKYKEILQHFRKSIKNMEKEINDRVNERVNEALNDINKCDINKMNRNKSNKHAKINRTALMREISDESDSEIESISDCLENEDIQSEDEHDQELNRQSSNQHFSFFSWGSQSSQPSYDYEEMVSIGDCIYSKDELQEIINLYENLIAQYLPEGALLDGVTPNQIWNWLILIFEEHVELKESLNGQFVEKIFKILGTKNHMSIIRILENMLKKI